jgi:hypothetical protein
MIRRQNANNNIIKIDKHYLLVMLLWITIPFIIFSLGTNKDYRYLLPIFPAIAACIAYLIDIVIKHERVGAMVSIIMIIPVLQFLYCTIPIQENFKYGIAGWTLIDYQYDYAYRPDNKSIWNQDVIIDDIIKDSNKNYPNKIPDVYLIVDYKYFNINNFLYEKAYKLSNINITQFWTRDENDWQQNKEKIINANYLITKTGDQGPEWTTFINAKLQEELKSGQLPFTAILEYHLPDSSEAIVYEHNR